VAAGADPPAKFAPGISSAVAPRAFRVDGGGLGVGVWVVCGVGAASRAAGGAPGGAKDTV
jgi:hypothetical protein